MYVSTTLLSFLLSFFNDPPTTEIYTLSLHDALPISPWRRRREAVREPSVDRVGARLHWRHFMKIAPTRSTEDRKSTRLNSSHTVISYAVFCLKKKKKKYKKK